MYIRRPTATALQTACRGEPRTPIILQRCDPQKERTTKTNKTKMIAMRFRESDYAAIKKKAEKVNMNFTEFVTSAAMNKSITVINGLSEVLKEQKAIGRNINQLKTLCNMGKIVCPDLQELKQQYADVLATLNDMVGRCG